MKKSEEDDEGVRKRVENGQLKLGEVFQRVRLIYLSPKSFCAVFS